MDSTIHWTNHYPMDNAIGFPNTYPTYIAIYLGPVARSLVSANRWLRGIKMYRFPWYLTLVSTNHVSSNPGLEDNSIQQLNNQGQKFISVGAYVSG